MKLLLIKSVVFSLVSISSLGCQSQVELTPVEIDPNANHVTVDNNQVNKKEVNQLKRKYAVCKKSSSPMLKNKSKLKEMLFKEGKLNSDMSEDEINTYVNEYIKKKSSVPCKPLSK
ncbi:hypothetical protein ACPUVO_12110 [Pseudocolwellia sp. HL-MZ19]|uniref:hypothetical protein n=1 Tax=unclassified Pseudocolwellia TaxID=2848178 RepID=UPI003CF0EF83